jgi:tetratricopeptide (TPR) repeat protein
VNPCPPPDRLARWLTGERTAADTDTLEAHLRGCDACRAALDRLTERDGPTEGSPAPGPPLPFLAPPRRPGDLGCLGPYPVEAELGRGGMGIVLRAFDEALGRTVALKVLRPELDNAPARARFVREARAAAQVKHDNVVGVYAVANPADGLPYFTMEYLAGPTLAEMIHRGPGLPPAEAAGLVRQAAEGLAAAHAAGLVHRDVKPQNIMVDPATGRAKLLDFGLVRLAERSDEETQAGATPGTPSYMSPEQAKGEAVDARTDVYGLGATLYAALTAEAPFRGRPHLVMQQVLSDEPRPPRLLNDTVPRDLETVCLKAMAKEPARRYPSAQAFADDLGRWLRGEPVAARPAGAAERAWRWCRRNPRVALLTATVAGLLVVLAAGSLAAAVWLNSAWSRAEEQRSAAETERGRAEQKAREADANLAVALDAVNDLLAQAQLHLGTRAGTIPLQRKLVELGIARLNRVVEASAGNAATDRSMVVAHNRLGDLYRLAGQGDESLRSYGRARDLADALLAAEPGQRQVQRDLAYTLDQLGDADSLAGRWAGAESAYRRALRLREAVVKAEPDEPQWRRSVCVSQNRLGALALARGDAPAAREWFAAGLRGTEELAPTFPDRSQLRADLAYGHSSLGRADARLGDVPSATRHYGQAVAAYEALVKDEPEHPRWRLSLAINYGLLGALRANECDWPAAVDWYRKSLAAHEALAAADPDSYPAQLNVALAARLLAHSLTGAGDLDGAVAALRHALEVAERLAGADPLTPAKHAEVAAYCFRLALAEARRDRFAPAAAWCERGLEGLRRREAEGRDLGAAARTLRPALEIGAEAGRVAAAGLDDLPRLLRQRPALVPPLLALRALALARRGAHAESTATAERLLALAPNDAAVQESLARSFALCCRAVTADRGPDGLSAEAEALRRRYAAAAVAALNRLRQLDRPRYQEVLTFFEPDLEPIRTEPALQALLADLRKAPAAD